MTNELCGAHPTGKEALKRNPHQWVSKSNQRLKLRASEMDQQEKELAAKLNSLTEPRTDGVEEERGLQRPQPPSHWERKERGTPSPVGWASRKSGPLPPSPPNRLTQPSN